MDDILIVAAHPDDEALGCGGAIARHSEKGDNVHVIYMTNGVSARNFSTQDIQNRQKAAKKAAKILGISSVNFFDFPDNKMDSIPLLDIVQAIESVTKDINTKVIYTHHIGDLNVDHQITHKAVMTAFRPTPWSSIKEIYTFEVMSSTDWNFSEKNTFNPNYFIEISNFIDLKLSALKAYNMELRNTPHSRSISHVESLAKFRGNTIGVEMAEAFMVVRKLIKN